MVVPKSVAKPTFGTATAPIPAPDVFNAQATSAATIYGGLEQQTKTQRSELITLNGENKALNAKLAKVAKLL